jgi:hypothetical protein
MPSIGEMLLRAENGGRSEDQVEGCKCMHSRPTSMMWRYLKFPLWCTPAVVKSGVGEHEEY